MFALGIALEVITSPKRFASVGGPRTMGTGGLANEVLVLVLAAARGPKSNRSSEGDQGIMGEFPTKGGVDRVNRDCAPPPEMFGPDPDIVVNSKLLRGTAIDRWVSGRMYGSWDCRGPTLVGLASILV